MILSIKQALVFGLLAYGGGALIMVSHQPDSHSVSWFLAHQAQLGTTLAYCNEHPGSHWADCAAAMTARSRSDWQELRTSLPK